MRRNKDYSEWRKDIYTADNIISSVSNSLNGLRDVINQSATILSRNGVNASLLYNSQIKIHEACSMIEKLRLDIAYDVIGKAQSTRRSRNKGIL